MAYRFSECKGKRFVAWEDLCIEISNKKLVFYDKSEPSVRKEFPLDYYYTDSTGVSYGDYKTLNTETTDGGVVEGKTCRELNIAPTWSVPNVKKPDMIDGLSNIWIPT